MSKCNHTETAITCEHDKLTKIDSPANGVDWDHAGSSQSYRVYRCDQCKHIVGVRHQWDAGTGSDDRWYDFGIVDPKTVKRHY